MHVTHAIGGGVRSILIWVRQVLVHVTNLALVHVSKTVTWGERMNSKVPGGDNIGVMRGGTMMLIQRGNVIEQQHH